MKIINPATGEKLEELTPDTVESVDKKFNECQKAHRLWADTDFRDRKKIIFNFHEILKNHTEDCASILTGETGKPLQQSKNEIGATLERISYFMDKVESLLEEKVCFQNDSMTEMVSMEPLGVVANISAWNYPYFVGTNVIIPALLTGNGVLYKPSEYASLTGRRIKNMFDEAGLPQHLFGLIEGTGKQGSYLLDQSIDGIFFTGSYKTGRAIYEKAASKMIVTGLELGGKDPCYVTEDVDVASVAAKAADGAFYNAGQSCCAVERIYVHESIYENFLEHFINTVSQFKVGLPTASDTYMGPLTRGEQIPFLLEQIDDAKSKGASVVLGGKPLNDLSPNYFEPTVLTNVNHSMLLMQEESFGPIIGIQKVVNDQQCCELMNDTQYGLTASVYCRNIERAKGILKNLNTGTVYVNCCDRVSPYVPWSGRKCSGIGSTLGEIGIQSFLQPKSWQIKQN